MTECSIKLELPLGVGKRTVGIFDEGRVTSDGGLWLVRLADREMGLTERMERSLTEACAIK